AAGELRDVELRLNETTLELRRFLDSLEAEPDRVEQGEPELDRIAAPERDCVQQLESELERIADAKPRFRAETYEELLARAVDARTELAALDEGADPLAAAAASVAEAEKRCNGLTKQRPKARRSASEPFAKAVEKELHGIGLGDG